MTWRDSAPSLAPGPRGPQALAFLQRDPLDFFMTCHRTYGDVVGFNTGPDRIAHLVCHPGAVAHVLIRNRGAYAKGPPIEESEVSDRPRDLTRRGSLLTRRFLLGQGLLTSEGALWKQQRRTIYPVFQTENVRGFLSTMEESAGRILDRWTDLCDPTLRVDMEDEMTRLGLDVICRTLFGADLTGEQAESITDLLRKILALTNSRADKQFGLSESLPEPPNEEFVRLVDTFDAMIFAMIEERRAAQSVEGSFLSLLLSARDEETGLAMNDHQVRDEIVTAFLAGHETTASALSWTLYLLSQHQDLQRKVQMEVDTLLDGDVELREVVSSLELTGRVIEESLRLYPPAWLIMRHTLQEDEIRGSRIPAGSDVIISPFVVHRHQKFWENPEEFRPERFNRKNRADQERYSYIPFGAGPRICIGRNFALMEIRLIVASILKKFRLDPASEPAVRPRARFVLQSESGIPVVLGPR